MRVLILGLGFILMFQITGLANSKAYYEAMVNLKLIEKYFTETPIYLSNDETLKNNLKVKLNRIIDTLESYHQTEPSYPDNYFVLFLLGKAYSFSHDLDIKGAWEKSTDYLDLALQVRPDSEEALLIQAKNYSDAEKDEAALSLYNRAIASNYAGRGRLYRAITKIKLKQQAEARLDLKEHLEMYPTDDYAKKVLIAISEK